MSTTMDRALQSKTLFWGFVGVVGIVAAYAIMNNENMFPKIKEEARDIKAKIEPEVKRAAGKAKAEVEQHHPEHSEQHAAHTPAGHPTDWSEEDLEAWLKSHKSSVTGHETKNELIAMVESAMHAPGFRG